MFGDTERALMSDMGVISCEIPNSRSFTKSQKFILTLFMRECAAILPTAMLELSAVNQKCHRPHQFCFNKRRKMSQFVLFSNVSVMRQRWHRVIRCVCMCVCSLHV